MRCLSRIHVYLGIALPVMALLAVATISAASADTAVRVRLDWAAFGLHAPFFVAVDKGWFKEKGLDVTVDDGNGSSKTITLVGAGKYDIGHANLSAMVLAKN
jgi:NitT/TauT family transport system substrate-binding protein